MASDGQFERIWRLTGGSWRRRRVIAARRPGAAGKWQRGGRRAEGARQYRWVSSLKRCAGSFQPLLCRQRAASDAWLTRACTLATFPATGCPVSAFVDLIHLPPRTRQNETIIISCLNLAIAT